MSDEMQRERTDPGERSREEALSVSLLPHLTLGTIFHVAHDNTQITSESKTACYQEAY